MKKLFITAAMVFAVNALGSIEYDGVRDEPTAQEISKNRACFEELARNGCGDPGEDYKQFRSCLSNVFPILSPSCQQMMSRLYGRKK